MAEMNTIVAANLHSPRFSSSKFSAPKAVPHLVPRARLHDRLDRGLQSRLTLVVASPGAGKSMLLADWMAARPVRRLARRPGDNRPVRPRLPGRLPSGPAIGPGRILPSRSLPRPD